MKARKALVTGASGHIGSTLCRALLARGVEVVAFVRPTSDRSALERLGKGLEGGGALTLSVGDILEPPTLAAAAAGCDVIFHNAAAFAIDTNQVAADVIRRVAVEGSCNVMRVAREVGAGRVVLTSSVVAAGFAERPGELMTETSLTIAPSDFRVPYYRAKVEAEHLAMDLARSLDVDAVSVLPTLVIGPGDHRITPSSRFILDFLTGRGVTVDGGANVIDVRDVAATMIAAAERGARGGRYILGGENLLVRELAAIASSAGAQPRRGVPHLGLPKWALTTLAAAMELTTSIVGGTPPITRAIVHDLVGRYAWYDTSRARTELGLVTRDLRETIKDTAAFFRAQGLLADGPKGDLAGAVAAGASGAEAGQ